jgi:type IV pilus assembly protein PilC
MIFLAFEEPEMKELVASLLDDLQKGRTLSESIAAHPSIFSPVYISLIRVGEQTGRLDEVLKELTEMLKWEDELVAKAKKIMIYPAIVLAVVLGVVIMMMLFVVPQLLDFIKEMGGELGMPTQALIATSNFVQQYILLILIFPFIIAFILRYARQKFTLFRYKTDCMLLGIPIIGEVFYKIKLSRLSSSLASMYSAGIGFSEALELSKKVVNNLCLEERLDEANRFIQQGELIHSAFRLTSIFPLMAIYMLQAGEQSGRLDSGLRNISYFLDRDVNERIEKIEPMIEPVITVLLAVIVGWVMMAVLGPIYDMMTKIKF